MMIPRTRPFQALVSLSLVVALGAATSASGAILTVQPGESIQAAIDAASSGDTIEVLP